jgi:hypothetical protein
MQEKSALFFIFFKVEAAGLEPTKPIQGWISDACSGLYQFAYASVLF